MARTFNGTTDKLEVASSVVTVTATFPLTLACWFRPSALTLGTCVSIGSSTAGFFHALLMTAAGVANFETNTGSAVDAIGPGTLIIGQWYHLAGVRSSATAAICYVNGVAGSTIATSVGAAFATAPNRTTIGGVEITGTYSSIRSGDICQVGAWNTALSGANIAALAVPGTRVDSVGSPVGAWRMEYPGASPETDSGSGAHTMTVTGTNVTLDPWWNPDANAGQHLGERPATAPLTPNLQH